MCLSIPAQLVSIRGEGLDAMGIVSLSGVSTEVSLAYVPQAKIGDYLLVHVGFAISVIEEEDAQFLLAIQANEESGH